MQGEAWEEEAVFTAPARAHVGLPGLSLPSPYTLPRNIREMTVSPRFPAVVLISTRPCWEGLAEPCATSQHIRKVFTHVGTPAPHPWTCWPLSRF